MISQAIGTIGPLDAASVEKVLLAGAAAPSNHNTQPWRFRCTPDAIELYGDPSRALPAADPDNRELRLACGAALLNMRLQVAALGRRPLVELPMDSIGSWRLAVLRVGEPAAIGSRDADLARAIHQRRTNRRPFLDTPVHLHEATVLRRAAAAEGAVLVIVEDIAIRDRLRELVRRAHQIQQDDPAFRTEWSRWVGRADGGVDGVPSRSAGPTPELQDPWVLRDFAAGAGRSRLPGKDFEAEPLLAVLCAYQDLPIGQVQAGQALQRVLLTATTHGLAASFLSQAVEVHTQRAELGKLLGPMLWPQAVLRLGYGSPAPPTPRRPLTEMLMPHDG